MLISSKRPSTTYCHTCVTALIHAAARGFVVFTNSTPPKHAWTEPGRQIHDDLHTVQSAKNSATSNAPRLSATKKSFGISVQKQLPQLVDKQCPIQATTTSFLHHPLSSPSLFSSPSAIISLCNHYRDESLEGQETLLQPPRPPNKSPCVRR